MSIKTIRTVAADGMLTGLEGLTKRPVDTLHETLYGPKRGSLPGLLPKTPPAPRKTHAYDPKELVDKEGEGVATLSDLYQDGGGTRVTQKTNRIDIPQIRMGASSRQTKARR